MITRALYIFISIILLISLALITEAFIRGEDVPRKENFIPIEIREYLDSSNI